MPHRILWSSDHHFGHKALLDERMSVRRRFASIEAHDEALIANWMLSRVAGASCGISAARACPGYVSIPRGRNWYQAGITRTGRPRPRKRPES